MVSKIHGYGMARAAALAVILLATVSFVHCDSDRNYQKTTVDCGSVSTRESERHAFCTAK